MEMWIHGDRLGTNAFSVAADKQETFSMVTGDYTYKRPCKEERIHSSFVIRP
jgi:hypothetical protein